MTETQHTPGPWVFDPTNTGRNATFGYGLMAEPSRWTLAHIPLEVGGESDRKTAKAQAAADARLIAAAPTAPHECDPDCPGEQNRRKIEAHDDLLAALEDLIGDPGEAEWSAARDAIAKQQKGTVE